MGKIDISIAIPYHGDRSHWTMQTIRNMHSKVFVREIVVSIDKDTPGNILKIRKATEKFRKVVIYESDEKLFVFRNKVKAVTKCTYPWVALIDSDNIMGNQYIGPMLAQTLNPNVIYCPQIGMRSLDYTEFLGKDFDIHEAAVHVGNANFDMLLNTMNYIFHKDTWLSAVYPSYEKKYEPLTADSAYINYVCLKAGMVLRIAKRMMYIHTVHKGSSYLQYPKEGAQEYTKIKKLFKESVDEDLTSARDIHPREQGYLPSSSNIAATRRPDGKVYKKGEEER